MPSSVVSIGTNTNTSGATLAVTVGAAGVPANVLIVVVVTEKSTSGTSGTLADTQTNTWNTSQGGNLAGAIANGRGTVFFAFNSKALVNTNTITYTKNLSGAACAMSAFYVTGIGSQANPEVTAARATATGTTGTITVTSGSPGVQGCFFVGAFCDSGTSTAGASATFTNAANWVTPPVEANSGTTSGNARVDGGFRLQTGAIATFVYNPTMSSTAQQWALMITAFLVVPEPDLNLEGVFPTGLTATEIIGYHCS